MSIMVQSQPGKQFMRPYLSQKNSSEKKLGVAQVVDPEFKPQYQKQTPHKQIFPGENQNQTSNSVAIKTMKVSGANVNC
jgi:hypothetical protein